MKSRCCNLQAVISASGQVPMEWNRRNPTSYLDLSPMMSKMEDIFSIQYRLMRPEADSSRLDSFVGRCQGRQSCLPKIGWKKSFFPTVPCQVRINNRPASRCSALHEFLSLDLSSAASLHRVAFTSVPIITEEGARQTPFAASSVSASSRTPHQRIGTSGDDSPRHRLGISVSHHS